MKLSRYITVLFSLLVFIILPVNSKGQQVDDLSLLEWQADSLALIERHLEAIDIYREIIICQGEDIRIEDKDRLNYKIGNSLMLTGRDLEAMPYFSSVINNSNVKSDPGLDFDAMTGLGKTYEYTGKHDSAFYWYLEASTLVSQSADTPRIARGVRNMAQLLRVLKRIDEARYYCEQAIELIPGIDDYRAVANIYNEYAYLFELSENYDSAGYYYQQLIDLSIKNGYLKGESVGYSNLASVLEKQQRYEDALDLKYKGLEIDRKIDDYYGMMNSYRGLSTTYLLLKDYVNALDMLNNAHQLCDTSWIVELSGIHFGYYKIYRELDRISDALDHYESYIGFRERINMEESRQNVDELLIRYETELKEQQILLLEQETLLQTKRIRLQWLLIGVLILIGLLLTISSWFWVRNKNYELKQMKMELQHLIFRHKIDSKEDVEIELVVQPSEIYNEWGLTGRESEILYYLGQGYSNSEIGRALFISDNTVKFHIKNIYIKLDVKNRIQALLRCSADQQEPK